MILPSSTNLTRFGLSSDVVLMLIWEPNSFLFTKDGWRPLVTAAFCGHSSIVNLLLEAGADPNAPGPHQVKFCLDENFAFSLFSSKGRVLFFTLENFSRLHHLFGQLPRGTLTSSVLFYPKMQGTNRPNIIQDTIHYNIHGCFLTGPPQKERKTEKLM